MIYETPQSSLLVGVARCDITPPVGIYHRMWGAATHDRAAGVHRPLTATALCLLKNPGRPDEHQRRLVILSLDHCLLGAAEIAIVRDAIFTRARDPHLQVLVTFTHTHGAGLMSLDRARLPGGELIEPYLRDLADRCAELAHQAKDALQPAHISYGSGRCALAKNRDFWDEESHQFVCGFNPQEPADETVVVARVTTEQDHTLATIVNYACHPTTLAWENQLISPDYIGALRETIEAVTHGAPCIFLQGASAELGPWEGFVGDVSVADRNGRQLAYAALEALTALPPPGTSYVYQGPTISGATLGTWKHLPWNESRQQQSQICLAGGRTLDLPYRADRPQREQVAADLAAAEVQKNNAQAQGNEAAARDAHALIERQTRMLRRLAELPAGNYPYRIQAWRIGDAIWLGVPGELYSRLQTELRAKFPRTPILVITLVDGWGPSYVVPQETYNQGLYQESIAVLAPGSFEKIIAACGEAIQELLEAAPAD